jgi:hypothetical protein
MRLAPGLHLGSNGGAAMQRGGFAHRFDAGDILVLEALPGAGEVAGLEHIGKGFGGFADVHIRLLLKWRNANPQPAVMCVSFAQRRRWITIQPR